MFKISDNSPLYSYFAGMMYLNLHNVDKGRAFLDKSLSEAEGAKLLHDLNIIEIGLC